MLDESQLIQPDHSTSPSNGMTIHSTFLRFSELPLELQRQIWRAALPEKDNSAMFLYRSGCWEAREMPESDEPHPVKRQRLDFLPDRLGRTPIVSNLCSVDREARSIATSWAREHGFEIDLGADGKDHRIVRAFDPSKDVLYVETDEHGDFIRDRFTILHQDDFFGVWMWSDGSLVTRIAIHARSVPEVLTRDHLAAFCAMSLSYPYINTFYIIVNETDSLHTGGDEFVQTRWEIDIDDAQHGRSYFWKKGLSDFEVKTGKYVGDETLYSDMEEVILWGMPQRLDMISIGSLEIRPVRVKKYDKHAMYPC